MKWYRQGGGIYNRFGNKFFANRICTYNFWFFNFIFELNLILYVDLLLMNEKKAELVFFVFQMIVAVKRIINRFMCNLFQVKIFHKFFHRNL